MNKYLQINSIKSIDNPYYIVLYLLAKKYLRKGCEKLCR